MSRESLVSREVFLDEPFEERLAARYSSLSDTLQTAADFLKENPVDVATRPLRAIALGSGVSPASYSRLAKALGYEGFDVLREEMRSKIGQRVSHFADRAQRLQRGHGEGEASFAEAHLEACQSNLARIAQDFDETLLNRTVDTLFKARNVYLVGALGSTGIVEHISYMASFCAGNWFMLNRMGASLGSGLADIGSRDVLLVVTKPPFAPNTIKAVQLAARRGCQVVVITDSLSCPALKHAAIRLVVPTESPHFFSSYVPTMFLAETLMSMFVRRAGSSARRRIAEVEENNRDLSEVGAVE